jgi:hypothetical protein
MTSQVLVAGMTANMVNNANRFAGFVSGVWTTTDTLARMVMPAAGTLSLLRVELAAAPGTAASGKSLAFTVMKNNVAQTLAVTITDTATSAEDTSHSVSYNAGDTLSLRCVPTSTPTVSLARFAAQYDTSGGSAAICTTGSEVATTTGATAYNVIGGNGASAWNATETNMQTVWATGGTITALYIAQSAASGTGASYTYTVMLNGVAQASSAVLVSGNVATAGNVTGLSIALAPGDTLTIRAVPSGTPSALTVSWGIAYTTTNPGEWNVGMSTTAMSTGAGPTYVVPNGQSADVGDGTQSNRVALGGAATGSIAYAVQSIYGKMATTPGSGKTRTLSLYVANSLAALAFTVANPNTTGNVTGGNILVSPGDELALGWTGSGTPAASGIISWSIKCGPYETSVALSGVAATGSAGTAGVTHATALVGSAASGAAGALTAVQGLVLSGLAAVGQQGVLTPSTGGGFTGFIRVAVNGAIITLATVAETDAPAAGGAWLLERGGVVYAVQLVAVDDAHASPVHIQTSNGIWAARLYP